MFTKNSKVQINDFIQLVEYNIYSIILLIRISDFVAAINFPK